MKPSRMNLSASAFVAVILLTFLVGGTCKAYIRHIAFDRNIYIGTGKYILIELV